MQRKSSVYWSTWPTLFFFFFLGVRTRPSHVGPQELSRPRNPKRTSAALSNKERALSKRKSPLQTKKEPFQEFVRRSLLKTRVICVFVCVFICVCVCKQHCNCRTHTHACTRTHHEKGLVPKGPPTIQGLGFRLIQKSSARKKKFSPGSASLRDLF